MSSFTVSTGFATYTGFRAAPQVRAAPVSAAAADWRPTHASFQGLRVLAPAPCECAATATADADPSSLRPTTHASAHQQKAVAKAATVPRVGGRASLVVQANKKVAKKASVVLTQSDPNLGAAGDLVEVSLGFFRNHLEPMGKAKKATAEILAEVEAQAASEVAAKAAESAGAKAIATALKTIGKFVVKKTVGEDGKIFGSVTAAEVADAVEQQTGKALDKKSINVPEISEIGIYDVTVKLHPDVVGEFKVDVQKA
jgi:large subunit ribosomal protein L9